MPGDVNHRRGRHLRPGRLGGLRVELRHLERQAQVVSGVPGLVESVVEVAVADWSLVLGVRGRVPRVRLTVSAEPPDRHPGLAARVRGPHTDGPLDPVDYRATAEVVSVLVPYGQVAGDRRSRG